VWTGSQAQELYLIDHLGGYHEALNYSKSLLGVAEDEPVTLKNFPKPESTADKLFKLLDRLSDFGASMEGLGRITQILQNVLTPVLDLLQTQPGQVKMPNISLQGS